VLVSNEQKGGQTMSGKRHYHLENCGCYADGARGIYTIERIINFALSHGFNADLVDNSVDGYDHSELEDEVDNYMNEYYMVHGAFWGRNENGDWGLWSTKVEDK
jgi:hypothetical protein